MPRIRPFAAFALLAASLPAQQQKHIAYPERDILSPFRMPGETYAPPDKLFALLRQMRAIADDAASRKSFDDAGREVVDDERWRRLRDEAVRLGIDAGYLASIMRLSKNADDRATAFYAAFLCDNVDYVLNLVAHIPGEPVQRTREAAMPRAAAFARANLVRRYGQLTDEQKRALTLPKPGTPEAKAAGITRGPRDEDHLHTLRLVPFFQLLDRDDPLDQAQALWFLDQVFQVRGDLALLWLEPVLPRLRQLLQSEDERVREHTIALLATVGPADLPRPALDAPATELHAWAEKAEKALFPPIRNYNDTVVQMHPSPERDAVLAAGRKALEGDSLGETARGKTKDGMPYRGFRVAVVPDALQPLAIPAEAVITSINGVPVATSSEVLTTVRTLLDKLGHPRVLVVEFVAKGETHAIEYRIL